MGSIYSMLICSHINFYSLTLKVHFDRLWPLWPLFDIFDNFFQLLNIHFNISNRRASSEVTLILVISLNKFRFLGPKNGRLLNRERIVHHRTTCTNSSSIVQNWDKMAIVFPACLPLHTLHYSLIKMQSFIQYSGIG